MENHLEIRKLPPSKIDALVKILEYGEQWKRLMTIIPTILEEDTFVCDLKVGNMAKYHTDHFRMIEDAGRQYRRECASILLDEWGTSGRIRPSVGHLLYLLKKAELFRAADYVAIDILGQAPPERPKDGPAATVSIDLPSDQQHIEQILDHIQCNTTDIEEALERDLRPENNLDNDAGSNTERVIPKIIVTDSAMIDSQNRIPALRSRQEASDLIKFSSVIKSKDLPDFSTLITESSNSVNITSNTSEENNGNTENSAANIPAFSCLINNSSELPSNIINDTTNSTSEVPDLSYLLRSSGNITNTSTDIDNAGISENESYNSTGNSGSHGSIPAFDHLINSERNNENNTDSNVIPSLDTLMNGDTVSDIPALSALLIHDDSNLENISSVDNIPSFNRLLETKLSTPNNSDQSRASTATTCSSQLPTLSLKTKLPHFAYADLEKATGNFQKEDGFLGAGAFGSVHLAVDLLQKPVAVKKLFLTATEDLIVKQFRNEVEILSEYEHENLLGICGYSCDGPTYCLLYDYISGGALNCRLQNHKSELLWQDRLKIARETADAIAYLHTASSTPLVHRDIKTANILLDNLNRPKLGDFGLIKLTPSKNTAFTTTIIGTSVYMAPEAFRSGDVSEKTDSFSFGVVILELLTALAPFDEKRENRDLISHVEEICEDDHIEPLLDKSTGSWMCDTTNVAAELYKVASRCLEEKRKRPNMVEVRNNLHLIVLDN